MWGHGAWDWVIVGAAWVLAVGFFRVLGGVGAACDAIADWGRESTRRRIHRVAPEYAKLAENAPRIARLPPRR
jgi:hypothetical protein